MLLAEKEEVLVTEGWMLRARWMRRVLEGEVKFHLSMVRESLRVLGATVNSTPALARGTVTAKKE